MRAARYGGDEEAPPRPPGEGNGARGHQHEVRKGCADDKVEKIHQIEQRGRVYTMVLPKTQKTMNPAGTLVFFFL